MCSLSSERATENQPKKQRKLPPSFNHEESSLQEMASRNVVEQYLTQRPERLMSILARLPKKTRNQAIDTIHMKYFLRRTEPYTSSTLTDPWGHDMNAKNRLFNHDIVALLGFHDSAADMDYALVRVDEMPENVGLVLSAWYNWWCEIHNTPDKRQNASEHDGSATLATDSELDALSDAIDTRVEEMAGEHEDGEGHEDDDDEDGLGGFDDDSARDTLHDEVSNWFSDMTIVKKEAKDRRNICMLAPKITVRFEQDS